MKKTTTFKDEFIQDPFGYCLLGRMRWGYLAESHGFNHIDLSKEATSEELKNPILWVTQADALSQAATLIIKSAPDFKNMHEDLRGICDGQFRASGLMLVGYSLEICLKAMIIIKRGIEVYIKEEKSHSHHRLHKLGEFIPDLSSKDIAILKLLTHYVYWAGRYPDPGNGKEMQVEEVFSLAEQYKITAEDLFKLASRIMAYLRVIAEEKMN